MKILSNKKYNELILKSCKGMFGAVTDDMLLRENALLYEENKQLKEQLEYLRSNEYLNQVKWERNFNEELVKDLQQALLDIKTLIQHYGNEEKIIDIVNKALGDKENE